MLWATAFSLIMNTAVLIWNFYNPSAPVPDVITAAINATFVGLLALLANQALTPVADARIANGTPVNSGTSVVVPQSVVEGVPSEEILTDGGPA